MSLFSESELNNKTGSIEVVCGSMFSGKTEELIRRMKRATFARQRVEMYKPSTDKRYSETEVVSHDENAIPSTIINHSGNLLMLCNNVDVVCIDEAQFLDPGLVDVCQTLANRGIRVIIAGLDMDFKGMPFGPIPGLCAIADHVSKLHAICMRCGNLAQFSFRLSINEKQVMLGEKESYEPLCRSCYVKAKKKL
jgi:thymidine kinase